MWWCLRAVNLLHVARTINTRLVYRLFGITPSNSIWNQRKTIISRTNIWRIYAVSANPAEYPTQAPETASKFYISSLDISIADKVYVQLALHSPKGRSQLPSIWTAWLGEDHKDNRRVACRTNAKPFLAVANSTWLLSHMVRANIECCTRSVWGIVEAFSILYPVLVRRLSCMDECIIGISDIFEILILVV